MREMRAEGVGKKRRLGSFVLRRGDVEEETLGGYKTSILFPQ